MSKRSGSEKRIMTDSITVRVDPDLYDRILYAAKREGMEKPVDENIGSGASISAGGIWNLTSHLCGPAQIVGHEATATAASCSRSEPQRTSRPLAFPSWV